MGDVSDLKLEKEDLVTTEDGGMLVLLVRGLQ